MNTLFTKITAATAAVIGLGFLPLSEAQAASLINFSYDFDNGAGSITGTVEGDVAADGVTVENPTNFNATFSGLPNVTFNQFSSGSQPVLTLGTITEAAVNDTSVPFVFLAASSDGGAQLQVNSVLAGQTAFVVDPQAPDSFVQDLSRFGTWNAGFAEESTDIPEPTAVLGLMVVAGYLVPKFSKRQAQA